MMKGLPVSSKVTYIEIEKRNAERKRKRNRKEPRNSQFEKRTNRKSPDIFLKTTSKTAIEEKDGTSASFMFTLPSSGGSCILT